MLGPMSKQTRIFLILALAVVALYFIFPGDIPFISDSPDTIRKALQANDAGELARQGTMGSFGVSYHAVSTWIYQALLRVTHDLERMVLVKTVISLVLTLSGLVYIGNRLKFNWLPVLLMLLSPFLYMYHRVLWDNVWMIPASIWLFAAYVLYTQTFKPVALVLGVAMGVFMFHIHPMAAWFCVAWGLTMLIFHAKKLKRKGWTATIILVAGAALSAPYIYHLIEGWRKGGRFVEHQETSWMTPIKCIFGGSMFSFVGFFEHYGLNVAGPASVLPGVLVQGLIILTAIAIVVFLVGCVIGIQRIRQTLAQRHSIMLQEQLVVLALLAIVCNTAFFTITGQRFVPQYHNAIWIAHFYLLWYGFHALLEWRPKPFTILLGVQAAAMLVLLVNHMIFVHVNGGNRYHTYGATLANQVQVAETVAANLPGQTRLVKFAKNDRHFPHSYQLLLALASRKQGAPTEPAGKRVAIDFIVSHDDPDNGWIQAREMEAPPIPPPSAPPAAPATSPPAGANPGDPETPSPTP